VNGQQEQEASYDYSAFGEALHTGTLDSPWQFSSQRMDPETHLLHFLKRIYDPEIGRWLTPDPAGFVDGPNLYAYVSNNPLTHIDPLGLWSEGIYNFYQQSRQFVNSFTRGFVDDTTMGASSLLMGQHNMSGWSSTAGYYAGTATSLGVGLLYGGTWAKGVKYGGKALFNGGKLAYRTMAGERVVKGALDGRRIVKLAQETPTIKNTSKLFENVLVKDGVCNNNLLLKDYTSLTPKQYFSSKTYQEVETILLGKFGSPRGGGTYNKSFFNPKTGRTFNLHHDPSHRGGRPHVDIRKRGLPNDYYKDRPFYLLD
jgi:RHS repeat-associated protein